MFSRIYDSLLSLAYPQACKICSNSVENSADGVACSSCWEKTRIFTGAETLCFKCGQFLSENQTDFHTFCHRCDQHFYDRAIAAGIYEHALAASVLNLKSQPFIPKKLQKILLSRFFNSEFTAADLIIPVPLSKKRRFERGYNQAEIIARIIEKDSGVNLDALSLIRRSHTPVHRAGMDRKARALSVKDAFEVKRPKLIAGRNILLIDDVFTSGSTVSNCAKALKNKGADKVYAITLARAN